MVDQQLSDFLEMSGVDYKHIPHPIAYTAQETAAAAHIPGQFLAKTVIVKIAGDLAMVVLPATSKVDLRLLQTASGGIPVELASEREFQRQFPNCEPGAMPPFGNLYNMDVYATEELTHDPEIAFNAGSHRDLVQLSYKSWSKMVHPTIISN